MVSALHGPKKQKMQLAMEESELRSLKIPSSAHRGALSPSKNSFLPTLQEQAQERVQQLNKRERQRRIGPGGDSERSSIDQRLRGRPNDATPEHGVLSEISASLLDSLKEDFMSWDGVLNLEQFTRAMLRNLSSPPEPEEARSDRRRTTKSSLSRAVSFVNVEGETEDSEVDRALGLCAEGLSTQREPSKEAARCAAVVDLFKRIDVHAEGSITWDEVSNYLIDLGMAGNDEFTVDNIKTYEPSAVKDLTKHESVIEKLVYLEQIDALVCLSKDSRRFRLYDPKRCTKRSEVSGHRGTVINCCFVDAFSQIATTSADMSICLWDSVHLGLRNRMSTKDVQLCLQWDHQSKSLFSGSIDGTLSRWDLQQMCLSDTRRGQHKAPINDLLMVPDINLLASASSDGSILMWDTATMKTRKMFKGPKKGTFSLAYSMDFHCLLTAGLHQEALVWNPYVERMPIFRLKGHTHALCGVSVVPGTPQIVSADVTGTFRLWDMRNFRCVQSFVGNDSSNDLNTFCTIPTHKRLAAGDSVITLYDYMDEWGGENVTDSGGVTDALYNPNAGTFYTVSNKSVKTWGAGNGGLFKVLRDIAKDEITAACLADNGRKLYLGDSNGRVAAHSLNGGTLLTEFESHKADISCLAIWEGTNRLFSSSWDGVVKVHSDECSRAPQMKAEFQHHKDGVTCLTCSPELRLLATGGSDMQVVVYDIKTLKLENKFDRFVHVIAGMDFLPSRCLLAVADRGGLVSFWRVRPHPDQWQCVYHFRNVPIIERPPTPTDGGAVATGLGTIGSSSAGGGQPPPAPIPVSAVCFGAAAAMGVRGIDAPKLFFTADAKGGLRCWDLSVLFERRNIHEADLENLFDRMRAAQLSAQAATHRGAAASASGYELSLTNASHQSAMRLSGTQSTITAPGAYIGSTGGGGSGGAFLTGLELDGDERGGIGATTVRSAAVPTMSASQGAPTAQASERREEVRLVCEVEGHNEGVLKMSLTRQPGALITCGLDRKVRAWNMGLEPLGTLLQSRDRAFRFPHDPTVVRSEELKVAEELLERIGPVDAKSKLPALPAQRGGQDPQVELGVLTKRKPPRRRTASEVWKVTAEGFMSEDHADDEDYQILFDQMERVFQGPLVTEAAPDVIAQDRLVKHAQERQAGRMAHRSVPLTQEEATAAERLARAMKALGGDEHDTYGSMARALNPKLRVK